MGVGMALMVSAGVAYCAYKFRDHCGRYKVKRATLRYNEELQPGEGVYYIATSDFDPTVHIKPYTPLIEGVATGIYGFPGPGHPEHDAGEPPPSYDSWPNSATELTPGGQLNNNKNKRSNKTSTNIYPEPDLGGFPKIIITDCDGINNTQNVISLNGSDIILDIIEENRTKFGPKPQDTTPHKISERQISVTDKDEGICVDHDSSHGAQDSEGESPRQNIVHTNGHHYREQLI